MTITITGGRGGVGLRIDGDRVVAVGPDVVARPGDTVLDAGGGELLPGLHDHHVHLRALCAARASIDVRGMDGDRFADALRSAGGDGWVRVIGYHESIAGELDAAALDTIVDDRPVRVQHRTGAMWMLNSSAMRAVGAASSRLWREDRWLRERVPALDLDVAAVAREAAAYGITSFTDADPDRTTDDLVWLEAFPQTVTAMGPVGLRGNGSVAVGPVKVMLDDDALPALPDLVATIRAAHEEDRGVAFHCVTRAQAVLVVVALGDSGADGLDRIEHGAVLPNELLDDIAELGVTVVTQPSFVAERGDDYVRDVAADDLPHLYRAASLRSRGIRVLAGSDAPYASLDPWAAMHAATTRTIGVEEQLDDDHALALFVDDRQLLPGAIADVVARDDIGVRATIARGRVLFSR